MRKPSIQAAALVSVLASIPAAHAWGAAGHEIVATIAQIHLPKPVLSYVCDVLNPSVDLSPSEVVQSEAWPPCYLAPIAAWADQIRSRPQYRYTAPLHYVNSVDDFPADTCAFPGPHGWQGRETGNVLAALGNVTSVLREFAKGEQSVGAAEEALKFFVHWMGDVHQPLHMSGREKGGNGARVTWNGRVTNLHSVWDGLLIAQSIRTTPRNYSHPLTGTAGAFVEPHLRGAIYDSYIRRIMHEGLSVGGRFDSESHSWLDCPTPSFAVTPETPESGVEDGTQARLGMDSSSVQPLAITAPAGTERKWDDEVLCPYAWSKPIHALNCDLPIWPHELDSPGSHPSAYDIVDEYSWVHDAVEDLVELQNAGGRRPRPHPDLVELDTPGYAGKIARDWVVEKLLAQAGVRLAGILTDIFADVAGEQFRVRV